MELTPEQIFQRYLYAGAITRDPDAIAAMFTEDGVLEAPLTPAGHPLHHLAGRDAIRAGTAAYHRLPGPPGAVDLERTGYLVHEATEPGLFVAEIDVVLNQPDGSRTTMSLVQIFRVRDGRIVRLRDYFADPA
ncbi:hypothetical protein Aph02nite_06650 [Actinoplanes philippinensis]|uniref:SnoaL-like domain-containing protein n=1 Tax=Actinoplanes philippinensis TaxID=35752 RepID=A0A1I2CTS5_9ACTN|nr:nuclear transport factor 2 family protein [Actinoplanes philippinensis]GIE74715.1 hypothetical protein Aph02nite_06650 [Actinoplanes philippinensis]SFE71120.1 SnoaL-like domain-containing protein [Actinoplanes philippinensis]